jgi:hypothetical protein
MELGWGKTQYATETLPGTIIISTVQELTIRHTLDESSVKSPALLEAAPCWRRARAEERGVPSHAIGGHAGKVQDDVQIANAGISGDTPSPRRDFVHRRQTRIVIVQGRTRCCCAAVPLFCSPASKAALACHGERTRCYAAATIAPRRTAPCRFSMHRHRGIILQ